MLILKTTPWRVVRFADGSGGRWPAVEQPKKPVPVVATRCGTCKRPL